MLQKGLLSYAYPTISEDKIEALKLNRSRIKDLYENKPWGWEGDLEALKKDFEAFSSEWARSSIKQPDADLLSPVSAYASVISVVGDGRYAMGAYPINEYDQVLFECRQCISGQKTLGQFQRVGRSLVGKFASEVCGVNLTLGKRGGSGRGRGRDRVKKSRNFGFPKKKRAPKKSRKPKRRSVKKSRKPKRRSVKKSRKPKRRSVKKSRKPKRRSVKRKVSRKRRSVKRKVSRKRRSVKRKVSRKRRSVKKSPKRRSRKNN
jgi:hypothetical protein